jgi:hypothetical protein
LLLCGETDIERDAAGLSSSRLEHAPSPTATLEGTTHIVRYVNPRFVG